MYELVEQIISIVCRGSRDENRRLSFLSRNQAARTSFKLLFAVSFCSQALEHRFQASDDKRYLELESSTLLDFERERRCVSCSCFVCGCAARGPCLFSSPRSSGFF